MTHNVFIDIKTKIRKYSGNPKTGFFQFSNDSKVSDMNQILAKQGADSKFEAKANLKVLFLKYQICVHANAKS